MFTWCPRQIAGGSTSKTITPMFLGCDSWIIHPYNTLAPRIGNIRKHTLLSDHFYRLIMQGPH